MDRHEQLRRIAAASTAIAHRLATRVLPFDGGTAFLDDDFPLRYDANYLTVEAPRPMTGAEALDGVADRILGGAGLEHREIVVPDEELGRTMASDFRELDYHVEHLSTMIHDGSAVDPARAVGAQPASFELVRPFLVELNRRAPWSDGQGEAIEMLADYRGKLERAIDCSFIVARVDGRIASACELYLRDGVAQIEDVNTLEEFRGRGLASACVTSAIGIARRRGADVVFLEADVDDWPQRLYERLGFVHAARSWAFVKWAPSDARRASR